MWDLTVFGNSEVYNEDDGWLSKHGIEVMKDEL